MWKPANDTELALARAMSEDRRRDFFQILTTADLYLPQVAEETDGQTFITGEAFGRTVLPVYTSVEGLAEQVSGVADAYTRTSYAELREKWPQPEWQLAVNPGLPIDAYLPIEAVAAAAAGDLTAVTAAEAVIDGLAEDDAVASLWLDTDVALREAAERGDADGYVNALLDAMVLVPTERELTAAEAASVSADLPWLLAPGRTVPTVQLFTSEDMFQRAYPDPVPSLTVPFAYLLIEWPAEHGLSVNRGTELNVELPPDQVRMLLLWGGVGEPENPAPGPER